MNDIIEKLKKNRVRFDLLTAEERACFESVEHKNCLYWSIWGCPSGGMWRKPSCGRTFSYSDTYRISPTYQPEPEVEKCVVEVFDMHEINNEYSVIGYTKRHKKGGDAEFHHLTEALNDPDFMWFEYENKYATNESRQLKEGSAEWPKYVAFRKGDC